MDRRSMIRALALIGTLCVGLLGCIAGNGSVSSSGYTVGGSVSGLTGSGLVLQDNGSDNLSIDADGPFSFATPVRDGGTYDVSVLVQPSGTTQRCVVSNGSGTVSGTDISSVEVSCGTSCSLPSDCSGAVAPTCDTPTTCQGHRVDVSCVGGQCLTTNIDDDSGCDVSIVAKNCGLYAPAYCNGSEIQTEPVCPTSCSTSSECVSSAYCDGLGHCVLKQSSGSTCTSNEECQSGGCVDGVCE